MTKVLILGANGQLARHTTRCLLTHKGEPFRGHGVSLNGLSDLIVKLALTPGWNCGKGSA
jgi:nucleoside-diphosphate-sugar epimerase